MPTPSRELTYKMLCKAGVSEDSRRKFWWRFGKSFIVTEAMSEHAQRYDWDWIAEDIFSKTALAEYKRVYASIEDRHISATTLASVKYSNARRMLPALSAVAEYSASAASGWEKYEQVIKSARAAASDLEEYECYIESALEEYQNAVDQSGKEFNIVRARAWARVFISDAGYEADRTSAGKWHGLSKAFAWVQNFISGAKES